MTSRASQALVALVCAACGPGAPAAVDPPAPILDVAPPAANDAAAVPEVAVQPTGDVGARVARTLRVVTRTRGYRHTSIPDGLSALQALGAARGWSVVAHPDDAPLQPTTGDIVVLLNTTGDFLSDAELAALEAFVDRGGALLGIDAATDAEYESPAYGALLGTWFARHPAIQAARVHVVAPEHPAVAGLETPPQRTDEWYDFVARPNTTVLLTVDETSYVGGGMGDPHPIAWAHSRGAGRVFYTAMGHTAASYGEPWFRAHLDAALGWLDDR